jgi:hypothetical protein
VQRGARRARPAQAASRFPLAQNACQRTDFSCSEAFGLTKLVFNVQTAHCKAGKPISAKIFASREYWKSNLAFLFQLPRHSPKLCPACLSKIHHVFGQRRQTQTLKNQVDGSPTNATISRAGASHQNLCQSPKRKPSEASRQRRLHGLLERFFFLNSNTQRLCLKSS